MPKNETVGTAGKSRGELLESERLLEGTIDGIPDVIGVQDTEHRVLFYNEAGYRFLGLDHEQVFGRKCFELIGRHAPCPVCATTRCYRSKKPERVEKYLDHLDLWLDVRAYPILDSDGEIVRVVEHIRDITEKKAAERELQDRERQITLLLENMVDMVSVHDPDSTITYVSPSCESLLGFTREELMGQRSASFLHPDDVEPTLELISDACIGRKNQYAVQHRLQKKDGAYLWVETAGRLFYTDEGELEEVQCVVRDISDRKKAQEEKITLERQVQHAQKLESLGLLAGGIAHDFNNLLMAILGNADLALDSLSPVSPARQNLTEIERASKRAAELAKQMLAYSGKGLFVIEPIDATELVDEMSHLLSVTISKKAVLKYDFAKELPPFDGDATQVRQVIMNLITNASESLGDSQGVISLSTGIMHCDSAYLETVDEDVLAGQEDPPVEGDYVYFEVADTGCGMSDEVLRKVFDPFFTTKFTGRGLGMSAVLGIVRGHGGLLKVYTEEGKGTTFKVLFPAKGGTGLSIRPGDAGEASAVSGMGTVLVVDDEETVRAVGSQMLKRLGFRPLAAVDGEEAMEIFTRVRSEILCVLLDLTMPRMDGEETFRELRKLEPKTKVILCSGYNERDATRRFAGKGLAGFLQKPFNMAALKAKLFEVLGLEDSAD